jgi:hypothetical protein
MAVGNRIMEIRSRGRLSQTDPTRRPGFHKSSVSRLENGHTLSPVPGENTERCAPIAT